MSVFRPVLMILALVFTALTAASYEVVLLGDLHYDRADVHPADLKGHPQKELARNLKFWQDRAPKLLDAAAAKVNPATAFAVQVGDISQGDTSTQEGQELLFTDIMDKLGVRFKQTPLYVVKGNHDHRCPGNGAAFEKCILPRIKNDRLITGPNANYALVHEGDLYVFCDSEKPDLAWMKQVFAANPQSRHTFIITHLPVIPLPNNSPWWLLFRINKAMYADRIEFRKILTERQAIVICAHVHHPSRIEYQTEAGRISQITVSSMALSQTLSTWKQTGDKFESPSLAKRLAQSPALKPQIEEYTKYMTRSDFFQGSGFAVLRVENDKVFIDNYAAATPDAPSATWQLR
ncbi:MAG: metallophosphoesterase [Lentisphaeria bacterium]|nr:metallophosphoesterase [Lentisphaeria bacterium]